LRVTLLVKKKVPMATLKYKLTFDEILSLIGQFSREEQNQLLEQLKAMIKKPGEKEEPPLGDKGPGKFYKGLESIPPMESLEEITRKYALKKEQLEPLKELFKDAPSAEELVKMLTK